MESQKREMVFLILQFLGEEKYEEAARMLEKESGYFFNMRYLEGLVTKGRWDELDKYLSGFTKVDDNAFSKKIFFEIRKYKYLEALNRNDHAKAVEILRKDLKVFSTSNEDVFKGLTLLLTLQNIGECEELSQFGDTKWARATLLVELKKLIKANPIFRGKLQFPEFKNKRLRALINQSLNWQHQLCKNPKPNPYKKTLFVDHSCDKTNGAPAPSPVANPLMGSVPVVGGLSPIVPCGSTILPFDAPLKEWLARPFQVPHQANSGGPVGSAPAHKSASMLKRPRTPLTINPTMDYQTSDLIHAPKRSRPSPISKELNSLPVNDPPDTNSGQIHGLDDLPKTVVANLHEGAAVKSMDFHPLRQSVLLVGTNIGDIAVWEVGREERLAFRNFKVWELGSCSVSLQAALANEYTASVNRVIWSPDGNFFGVAYSKHIIHIYSYHGENDMKNHLEIEAHTGNVSDLVFARRLKEGSCIISCGEDQSIKVWDAATGAKQFTFEGHEAPVYSICAHCKNDSEYIFSTAVDGKIKVWKYDNKGSRANYNARSHSCSTMAYSADGKRLFQGGTSEDGESFIVEWNENEGTVMRSYHGLGKQSVGVVQFDMTKNRFLAAGDEFVIKYWDMDYENLLATVDAKGGLPASPCIRFNKEGTLLSVSTGANGVKILANVEGVRLMQSTEGCAIDPSRIASAFFSGSKGPMITAFGGPSSAVGTSFHEGDRISPVAASIAVVRTEDSRNLSDEEPSDDLEKLKARKPMEFNKPSQLRSLRLPDILLSVRIARLIYSNSGGAILALAHSALHKLWKWQQSDRNSTGKATTAMLPQRCQLYSGILMENDLLEINLEEVVPCFALSKNDCYVVTTSGGKISLFNTITCKTMKTFMAPPPATTVLAFHPQDNNIIAIGMEDSSIQIYDVRVDEVKSRFNGHQKRVTGLAFSSVLNVLVSSGADAQVCVWSTDGWEKKASKSLQIPYGRGSNPSAHTSVQFHQDQIHMLVVHETQLAIYEVSKLNCINQWVPQESQSAISDATYSCDSRSIYASFKDGIICIFTASSLRLRCRINPTAYLSSNPSSGVHQVVIAAHPQEPNQFALGLSDGGVVVLEPAEAEGNWGTAPPDENCAGASSSVPPPAAAGPAQCSLQ